LNAIVGILDGITLAKSKLFDSGVSRRPLFR
jgi:hypothetical protein